MLDLDTGQSAEKVSSTQMGWNVCKLEHNQAPMASSDDSQSAAQWSFNKEFLLKLRESQGHDQDH